MYTPMIIGRGKHLTAHIALLQSMCAFPSTLQPLIASSDATVGVSIVHPPSSKSGAARAPTAIVLNDVAFTASTSNVVSTGGLTHQGAPQLFLPSSNPSALIRSAIVSSGQYLSRVGLVPPAENMPLTSSLLEKVSAGRGISSASHSPTVRVFPGGQASARGMLEFLNTASSSGSNLQCALSQMAHQLAPFSAQSPGGAPPIIRPEPSRQLSASLQHAASLTPADAGMGRPPLGASGRVLREALSEPITSQRIHIAAGMGPRAASVPNPHDGAAGDGPHPEGAVAWWVTLIDSPAKWVLCTGFEKGHFGCLSQSPKLVCRRNRSSANFSCQIRHSLYQGLHN